MTLTPFERARILGYLGLFLMTNAGTFDEAHGADPDDARLLTNFTGEGNDFAWYVVNDNVMGGRSAGDFEVENGVLHFTGRTNTDGGGFSSLRTEPARLDLSDHGGLRLRVRGDGRRYTWRLSTDARYYGRPIGYWADFDTKDGEWQTVDVPFSQFVPRFRGSRLDGPPLDTQMIESMGLMIYDGLDGPFELQLSSVHAYRAADTFSFDDYRRKHRLLVVSAPDAKDERFADQMRAIDSTREEFAERDMLLITLLDGGTSGAGEQDLTSDEVAAARAELAIRPGSFSLRLIGKDGGVKYASERVVPMAEIYSLIDGMPMRRQEMQRR